ncbi:MAG: rubredoxin domain-containing protein [Cytophagaceae bacterium]|nr:rubredoxin domain-containing protein [Cytophagaceae bacterium]MDW8457143.1 rubredoxin domain-containing protein [Cytophagaceae bacterium]
MNYVKINTKGGILPITELDKILSLAENLKVTHCSLGERQNIFLHTNTNKNTFLLYAASADISTEWNRSFFPNIVSSYVTLGLYSSHPWMSEGVYKDVLDSLPEAPSIKINIADPTQGLIPLFTGDINIIPSEQQSYFYIYTKFNNQLRPLSILLYTNEIQKIIEKAEELNKENKLSPESLEHYILQHGLIHIPAASPLYIPRIRFPYFEGMNAYSNGFWLGIYRRNNQFDIEVLTSIRELCKNTGITELHITPWRTIIIKGIQEKNRIDWEKLLGKHELNTRHSALELNWYLHDHDKNALKIKNQLYRFFDSHDVRTYGLYFGIQTPGKSFSPFASILIKQRRNILPFTSTTKAFYFFDILYTKNFDPNSTEYIVHAYNVAWPQLTEKVNELCSRYYKYLTEHNQLHAVQSAQKENLPDQELTAVYECAECLSLYEHTCKPENCTICGAPSDGFVMKNVSKKMFLHQA